MIGARGIHDICQAIDPKSSKYRPPIHNGRMEVGIGVHILLHNRPTEVSDNRVTRRNKCCYLFPAVPGHGVPLIEGEGECTRGGARLSCNVICKGNLTLERRVLRKLEYPVAEDRLYIKDYFLKCRQFFYLYLCRIVHYPLYREAELHL